MDGDAAVGAQRARLREVRLLPGFGGRPDVWPIAETIRDTLEWAETQPDMSGKPGCRPSEKPSSSKSARSRARAGGREAKIGDVSPKAALQTPIRYRRTSNIEGKYSIS